ncbi:MAG: hypothetical protein K1X79_11795 [Oligoflexia bacterium]|nr:hypothetical protein [Oligoflexia bacterium]
MNLPRKRVSSEVLKRGYSDDEVANIYELGRFLLENGDLRRAEAIFGGLVELVPDFAPAWLGMAYLKVQGQDFEGAVQMVRHCLRVSPRNKEGMLFLVACVLSTGDMSTAGTYLGELGEMIESGELDDPLLVRFYKMQLARYQTRGA